MIKLTTALLISATVTLAAAADPITPSQAKALLENYGTALNGSTAAGQDSHVIDATFESGLHFSLRLGNCDQKNACSYAIMFSTFDIGRKADLATYIKSNHYNDSFPFGRSFVLTKDDPGEKDSVGIDYVIDLSGEANLDADDLEQFEVVLESYASHWSSGDEE